jgi:hypothetical protein
MWLGSILFFVALDLRISDVSYFIKRSDDFLATNLIYFTKRKSNAVAADLGHFIEAPSNFVRSKLVPLAKALSAGTIHLG